MVQRLTLLLTDVVDSTAQNAAAGDAAMRALWVAHDRLARHLIRHNDGTEIGRSDGFLVVFRCVPDAIRFADAYHRGLAGLEPALSARVGVHVGEVELRPNSQEDVAAGAVRYDIDGIALPVAARISAVARARQTLLSAEAAAEVGDPAVLRSHGYWRLKGVDEPIELFEAGACGSVSLPPDDGEKAYRVVAEADGWRPAKDIRHSLPPRLDSFVGRSADLRRIADAFQGGARLVSVVGTAGVGKTRIATQFARQWLGEFPGGAWFCDLAQARSADTLFLAVAQGMDVVLGAADPCGRLGDAIAGRGRCLVILDNFEQLTALGRSSVGTWLERTTDARFLVTTRERLDLTGEQIVVLDSMPVEDAGALYLQRASAIRQEVPVEAGEAAAVGQLVELLDGLPLAIELAAGRIGTLSPRAMLARIHQRFSLLAARGGRLKRQYTLRAAFDWSWDLLAPDEQALLAQASVFSGGFTLDAAEAVFAPDAAGGIGVLDTLQSLVDKSLVRLQRDRFNLLASVHDYAAEQLGRLAAPGSHPSVDLPALLARHGEHYTSLHGDPRERVAELENVLAACRRAIEQGDAERAARGCMAAWPMFETRGLFRVGIAMVEAALAIAGLGTIERMDLLFVHGRFLLVTGDPVRARTQLQQSLDAAHEAGQDRQAVRALASLAELNVVEGRIEDARPQYEEAVRRGATLGDTGLQCAALNGLGVYYNRLGQFEAARAPFGEALAVARAAGHRRWEGGTLSNLGLVAANLGHRKEAHLHYEEAIAVAVELGDRVWEGNLLCNLGLFKLEGGEAREARAHLEQSLKLAREGGLSLLESVVLCNLGLLHESLGDDATAEKAHRESLRVAARRGDVRTQGQVLGYLGLLVARRGAVADGRDLLAKGVSMLRRVQDRLSLAVALCRYAQGCSLWPDPEGRAASLDEAGAIAADLAVAPGSELARSLAAARGAASASP